MGAHPFNPGCSCSSPPPARSRALQGGPDRAGPCLLCDNFEPVHPTPSSSLRPSLKVISLLPLPIAPGPQLLLVLKDVPAPIKFLMEEMTSSQGSDQEARKQGSWGRSILSRRATEISPTQHWGGRHPPPVHPPAECAHGLNDTSAGGSRVALEGQS